MFFIGKLSFRHNKYSILIPPDINECDLLNPTHNCSLDSTICVNAVGNFTCDCLPGYIRTTSVLSCSGEWREGGREYNTLSNTRALLH